MKKTKKGKIFMWIIITILVIIVTYLIVMAILCRMSQQKMKEKLENMDVQIFESSLGKITYLDEGEGEVILSIHGMSGGYDQGFENIGLLKDQYRVIAPSRFGYLGSNIPGELSVSNQVKVFNELMQHLKIDRYFVLATSAGGTIAFKMALKMQQSIKGVILFSSAFPCVQKPTQKINLYQGMPSFLINDYMMYLLKPIVPYMLGLPSSTVDQMMLLKQRKKGMIIDATIVNPDMKVNFTDYDIESINIPFLIFHAKDDKMASFKKVEDGLSRIKSTVRFVKFDKGGHMLIGHSSTIENEVVTLIEAY